MTSFALGILREPKHILLLDKKKAIESCAQVSYITIYQLLRHIQLAQIREQAREEVSCRFVLLLSVPKVIFLRACNCSCSFAQQWKSYCLYTRGASTTHIPTSQSRGMTFLNDSLFGIGSDIYLYSLAHMLNVFCASRTTFDRYSSNAQRIYSM